MVLLDQHKFDLIHRFTLSLMVNDSASIERYGLGCHGPR